MTNEHSIRLESINPGKKIGHRLYIDGIDISQQVLGMNLSIQADQGNVPELVVRILPHNLSIDVDAFSVHLIEENHELLVRLGWTPPPEEAA